jgi:tRNA pseudouridine13 synthase
MVNKKSNKKYNKKFYTKTEGIGGRIKQRIEDFKVEEIPKKTFPLHDLMKRKDDKKYTVFWMEKFNWDTQGALMALAYQLRVYANVFSIAGTKDKRAITKQQVSTDLSASRLKSVRVKDIKLYNFSQGRKLELGDLDGNSFEIVVRNIELQKDETEKRLSEIQKELEKGIPNYFGPQRFGITRPITDVVGKEIIKGDLENAMRIYLCKVFPDEAEESKEARKFLDKHWNKYGYNKALEIYPTRLKYERLIISHLAENPKDFEGAFGRIPRRLRKIFPNAVQSRIFNRVLKKVGPVEGEIPIIGFDTVFGRNNLSGLIKKILKDEEIKASDFNIKILRDMKCSGGFRKAKLIPKNFKWKIEEDDYNEGKLKIIFNFILPSGSYATIVLKEIMKN